MILGSVFVPPGVGVVLGLVCWAAIGLYWWWMRSREIPASRLRIRRMSLVTMIVATPVIVSGLSFVDGAASPSAFIVVWMAALVLVGLIGLSAVMDMANSFRLNEAERRSALKGDMDALRAELRAKRSGEEA